MANSKYITCRVAVGALVALLAVTWGVACYYTPMMGDDLSTLGYLGGDSYTCPGYDTFIYTGQRYLSCNGRLGDLLWPTVTFLMPLWLRVAVCAMAVGAFYALAVMSAGMAGGNSESGRIMLIAALALLLPWWDYMLLYVCQFGYVWAALFGMWWLNAYFGRWGASPQVSAGGILAALALGGVTGGMHEAVGVSLVCGMIWHVGICGGRKDMTPRRMWMLAGLVAGMAFVLASPALWHRLGAGGEPDDAFVWIVLKNTSATLVLIICILIAAMRKSLRGEVWSMMRGEWGVWVIAAVAGMCISAVSGIVGRPGWFSQTCALVALWQLGNRVGLRWPWRPMAAVVAGVLWIAVAAVNVAFAVWQARLGREAAEVTELYGVSADGRVYFDATPDDAAPWITLGRCRGVPDADDTYLLEQFAMYHGDVTRPPVVLPEALEATERPDTCSLPGDMEVLNALPDNTAVRCAHNLTIMLCTDADGREYTVTPFRAGARTYYLKAPRVIDPGDR